MRSTYSSKLEEENCIKKNLGKVKKKIFFWFLFVLRMSVNKDKIIETDKNMLSNILVIYFYIEVT